MIKKKYKISVIIPTYNRSWIIKKALNSVLKQSCKNIESIIINDGSIDNTIETLNSYKSKINIINQKNSGISTSRNLGIKASSGNYIAFLDSDDYWLKRKISKQIIFFKKKYNAIACQTEEIWIKNNTKIIPKKKHKKISGMIFEQSLKLCLISPSAIMIKKNLFNNIGFFNEKFEACEDYDLWLKLTRKYPVHLLKIPLIVKIGGHKDQLSKTKKLDKIRIKSIKYTIKNKKLSSKQFKTAKKILIEKCCIYISGCIKRKKLSEAKKYKKIIYYFHNLIY